MDANGKLILLGFIALIAFMIYTGVKAEKKRIAALKLLARKLSFTFSESGRETTIPSHTSFKLFSQGSAHSRRLANEMWGRDRNNAISIFEYTYSEPRGKSSSQFTQTVLSIDCSKLNVPQFELEPECFLNRISHAFGFQDIDFELFPVFSQAYTLRGKDEEKIRELFTPKVIKFFEEHLFIYIEANNNTLIFYKPNNKLPPEFIEQFYKDGKEVLSNLI